MVFRRADLVRTDLITHPCTCFNGKLSPQTESKTEEAFTRCVTASYRTESLPAAYSPPRRVYADYCNQSIMKSLLTDDVCSMGHNTNISILNSCSHIKKTEFSFGIPHESIISWIL